ncbi:Phosphoribulokinase/uridine kinase [[Clostridium] ultunense Esp]|uniref:Phosphoribulokinase/uridine kinase n=1 Tax=[Clostridium] ultunense Esp TaxID=1288971 RepID=M1ZJ80_9FIRM|nr:nucleoside kinase [Schnuerera ultunensis]CCQ98593.1 Phosphoribulokinase/uridine kinase [[Clostridium] ultunense Esp]SHD77788.1 Phosphoribulokinase/uridine kinase [[Clostridium] ultunense Esp]
MKKKIKVHVEGIGEVLADEGYKLEKLSKKVFGKDYRKYIGARINNKIYNLQKNIEENMSIRFLSLKDEDGYKIYTRTISAVFIMACKEIFPQCTVKIEHFIGRGLYAELEEGKSISFSEIEKIKAKMKDIIEKDIPIFREKVPAEKGISLFKEQGYEDKVRLYNTLDKELIQTYKIGEHIDGFHGYLAPSTGYVNIFDLKYYYPGAIILFPTTDSVDRLPEFKEQKKLARVFKEANEWADILDLGYLGSLNEKVLNGDIGEVIRISEALHEKKIGHIADEICKDDDINIILIAGPSSSGKTTFAQRLAIHLKVNGKRPIAISVDDYFVDRDKTPLNEKGEYDFESIEAIDLKRLNEDLVKLLEGEEIELPKYNFITGKSENSGVKIKVDKDHPIIVEGIHGLNPRLTTYIPEKNKFKIYISALTQLNIDAHNRISTTDTRLIRRMVRDNKFRGNDIFRTFELWQGVTKGEEQNIFPFQEEADIMFDSALVYELSVLKKHAVPLLEKVDNSSIYYSECKRLLQFLKYFIDIEEENLIPPNSILREFIGGADINVH